MKPLPAALITAVALSLSAHAADIPARAAEPAGVSVPSAIPMPAWTLTDHRGRPMRAEDLRGKYALFVFGYTFCPDVCPTGLAQVSEVMEGLGNYARLVTPVFVTFDPGRDTAPVLADYLSHFHPALVGLTGPRDQIRPLEETFGVLVMPGPVAPDGSYFIAHSALKYLVWPDGKLRHTFDHEETPGQIVGFLTRLFQTADAGPRR